MSPRLRLLQPTRRALFAAVAVVLLLALAARKENAADESVDVLAAERAGKVTLPSAELAPDDVVRLQVAGLAAPAADGWGVLQCFVLASPANRAVTGPLERFARMVRNPMFVPLAKPRAFLVGRAQVDGDVARVLVTVIDDSATVRAYDWLLRRQSAAPIEGCWMTEGVVPASTPRSPESVEPSQPTDKPPEDVI